MIELQHLTKQYGEQVAVRDLSLTVGEGALLVLLGGSGSGKTTTLKMIIERNHASPSSGSPRSVAPRRSRGSVGRASASRCRSHVRPRARPLRGKPSRGVRAGRF